MSWLLSIVPQALGWLVSALFGKKAPTLDERAMAASEAYGRSDEVAKINSEVLDRVRQSQEARQRVDSDLAVRMRAGQSETPDDGFRRD